MRLIPALILLALAPLLSAQTPTTPATGPATLPASRPASASRPTEAIKVRVRITNQSFTISPVDIKATLDGKELVAKDFAVGTQHNYESFFTNLAAGTHELVLVSKKADLELKTNITIDAKFRWVEVAFWANQETKPTFQVRVVDENRKID